MKKRKIPHFLTDQEQQKLLEQFNTRYISSHRNKMIVKLILDSGLRLSELINLKWQDINLQTGKLTVREGKGAKDRALWVNDNTLMQLREWKKRQVEEIGRVVLVFTTRKGTKLDSRAVRESIYIYADKAGIQETITKHYHDQEGNRLDKTYEEKKVSPHTLRHTYATDMLRAGEDIRTIQKALGHSSITTTQIYTHIIDDELENSCKNFRKKLNNDK